MVTATCQNIILGSIVSFDTYRVYPEVADDSVMPNEFEFPCRLIALYSSRCCHILLRFVTRKPLQMSYPLVRTPLKSVCHMKVWCMVRSICTILIGCRVLMHKSTLFQRLNKWHNHLSQFHILCGTHSVICSQFICDRACSLSGHAPSFL